MLSFLPPPVRGVLVALLLSLNTVILFVPLMVVVICKVLLPIKIWQRWTSVVLVAIAETWITINNGILSLSPNLNIEVRGGDNLQYQGWYLVVCNHRSWVDILVLQWVFNRRIPMLKFFLKQELLWVPLLGVAWWGLDFPFMKRYSKEKLARHPELRGKDKETTKRACEKFKETPVSIMNFLEGTRFTGSKKEAQQSPYEHLLKPKTGGLAFVLSVMGEQLQSMLDVTLVYHQPKVGLWDLLCGRLTTISVDIKERQIPSAFNQGDYDTDPEFRAEIQAWVSQLWSEKDQTISQVLKQ